MFLKMAVLRAIYIGNIGKTAKIRHFVDLNPLNGLFYANFIAYPLGADARDILAQFWGVQNFVLGLGGPEKGSKMAIFGHFQVRRVSFHPLYTINSDFKSKMGLLSRVGHNRNNLKPFSHHFCITIFRYSANFDLGVTQFGAISAKKCLSVAYFSNYCFQNSPMMHFLTYIMKIAV